jgi:hypothetical protein
VLDDAFKRDTAVLSDVADAGDVLFFAELPPRPLQQVGSEFHGLRLAHQTVSEMPIHRALHLLVRGRDPSAAGASSESSRQYIRSVESKGAGAKHKRGGEPARQDAAGAVGGAVTVGLSKAPGDFAVEWHNPATGKAVGAVVGGRRRELKAPFKGDAVLYLVREGRM